MPMFPLGSVLFPGAVLPLQVFEPRYRSLVVDVSDGDGRFGVVLIDRGHEVGGGDSRTNIGTVAEIVRIGEAEDERILIVTVGRERIRINEWLEDDPYPLAEVDPFPDPVIGDNIESGLERALAARRRLLGLAIEMGAVDQRLDLDLPDETAAAVWGLCQAAPLGSFDRQRLLEIEGVHERLHVLEKMMSEQTADLMEVLRRR